MYPDLFTIGPVTLHSFGLMAMLGFLVGALIMRREFSRLGVEPDLAITISTAALIGGFVGARLYYIIEHWPDFAEPIPNVFWRGGFAWYGAVLGILLVGGWKFFAAKKEKTPAATLQLLKQNAGLLIFAAYLGGRIPIIIKYWQHLDKSFAMVFSGAGLVWYGGLFGGTLAVMWAIQHYKMPFWQTVDIVAMLLLVGQSFGRMGCFLSADGDYGPPSDVPWAMAFPNGVVPTTERVHPTPLYDIILLMTAFVLIWRIRKRPFAPGTLFGLYLIAAGSERFITEFWRRTPKIAFDWMTLAQMISIGMILAGAVLIYLRRKLTEGGFQR